MPDALIVLGEDHHQVLELLRELSEGARGAADARTRQALAEQLAIAASRHEVIEELCFWPLVRERVPGGAELAAQALDQEHAAKLLIQELDHVTADSEEFAVVIKRLESAVHDHVTLEERQVWPKVRLELSETELTGLGSRLESARTTTPTRPHPRTPEESRVLGTVGPAVGAIDRTRDVLSGRGVGARGLGRRRMALVGLALALPATALAVRAVLRARRNDDQPASARQLLRGVTTGAAAGAAAGATAVRRGGITLTAIFPRLASRPRAAWATARSLVVGALSSARR